MSVMQIVAGGKHHLNLPYMMQKGPGTVAALTTTRAASRFPSDVFSLLMYSCNGCVTKLSIYSLRI